MHERGLGEINKRRAAVDYLLLLLLLLLLVGVTDACIVISSSIAALLLFAFVAGTCNSRGLEELQPRIMSRHFYCISTPRI